MDDDSSSESDLNEKSVSISQFVAKMNKVNSDYFDIQNMFFTGDFVKKKKN